MTAQLAPIVGPASPDTQPSTITISKVRVKKGLLYCEFTEQHDLEAPARSFTMQGTQLLHEDLTAALAALVSHFVGLTEQLPTSHTDDDLKPFEVTGFSVSNKGGVTLSGNRTLTGGAVLHLTAPFVSFDEEQFEEYHGQEDLEATMSTVLREVEAALRGKCSDEGRQLQLFDPEQHQEEVMAEFGEVTPKIPALKKRKAKRIAE